MNVDPITADAAFQAGDKVVLAEGPYQGTTGEFLNLTKDPKWAEIQERGNQGHTARSRIHPVIWLKRAAGDATVGVTPTS